MRIWLVVVVLALGCAHPAQARAEDDPAALRVIELAVVPAEVERIVRFRAYGFGQDRPVGGSVEVAALLDSNINRATRADALGTVISGLLPGEAERAADSGKIGEGLLAGQGLFPGFPPDGGFLDDSGRARSALGMSVRGQAYLRRQIDNDADFLLRAAGSGEFYGDADFNDLALSLQAGPEYALGSDRIAVFAGPAWRWYGARPYSLAIGAGASWQHPLGRGAQLRIEAAAARVDNRRDDLLDGASYTFVAELDRVLSWRSGMGARFLLVRETARDPSYATTAAGIDLHAFREIGTTTFVATAGYVRLEADAPFPGFREARREDRFTASLSATLRALRLGPLAPIARVRWESNSSTVPLYDFERWSGEIGVTWAF